MACFQIEGGGVEVRLGAAPDLLAGGDAEGDRDRRADHEDQYRQTDPDPHGQ